MAHQACKSCGKHIRGGGKRWANISPLCENCYRYHCRNIITRSRLAEKIRRSSSPTKRGSLERRRSIWGWLFG
jgi:ribosome-binding protein aMBF1 (putative translation factor)